MTRLTIPYPLRPYNFAICLIVVAATRPGTRVVLDRFFKRSSQDAAGGLSIQASGVALAAIQRIGETAVGVAPVGYQVCAEEEADQRAALQTLPKLDSGRMQISSVLPAAHYQLLQVEAPNVPADELRPALRWRIKDLVDFPVDDAVVESFDMPAQANPGQKPVVYVVAAPGARIAQHLALVATLGIDPNVIDIPELCVRNVAVQLPHDADGLAFLYFAEDYGILTVTRQRVLYVVRRIELGHRHFAAIADNEAARADVSAQISLQIKRSLDYYESHYGNNPIAHLVLGPAPHLGGLADFLGDELGLRVEGLDLSELFNMDTATTPEDQNHCLLAIGAALRTVVEAA